MVKMVSLKRTEAERKVEEKGGAGITHGDLGGEGIHIHLQDHHVKKLGLHGNVESGRHVTVHGKGKVVDSHTTDRDGKKRKSLTIHLHEMGIDHGETAEEEHKERKADVEEAYSKSKGSK